MSKYDMRNTGFFS